MLQVASTRPAQRLGLVLWSGEPWRCRCYTPVRVGWRFQTLKWEHVRGDRIHLLNTKTGARTVQLPPTAVRLLEALPRRAGSSWVLPGNRPETHMSGIDTAWRTVRARAWLDDLRSHDLRHSFASRALALGESLPMIGKLLGHTQVQTTARYAHLANESVKASGSRVRNSIGAHIAPVEP